MNWNNEDRSEHNDCWALGEIQQDTQYSILEGHLCYILKISFRSGDNMREVGRFSTLEKAKNVAELIDQG